ncbi:MAG: GGDEF domain-containing protein [Actinobacteria bacterium]|nr:MAG: GGDEF domain-containing protein [Actinomycetota bacterium]
MAARERRPCVPRTDGQAAAARPARAARRRARRPGRSARTRRRRARRDAQPARAAACDPRGRDRGNGSARRSRARGWSGTTLVLYAPEGGFTDETRRTAEWLASQAAIALENAKLHHLVQRQATTDDLTGLVNRRRFIEALESEIVRANAFHSPLSVVLGDLDHFKLVNDRFGHQTGDEVLRRFADIVREHLRDVDVPGRIGGEEFAILLPETDAAGAVAVAERVRRSLRALRPTPERSGAVTASFGVAQLTPGETGDELLRRADVALYRAKSEGRNTVTVEAPG